MGMRPAYRRPPTVHGVRILYDLAEVARVSHAAVMGGRTVGRATWSGTRGCSAASWHCSCARDHHGAFGVRRRRHKAYGNSMHYLLRHLLVRRARVDVHGPGDAHAHPLVGEGRAVPAVPRHRHYWCWCWCPVSARTSTAARAGCGWVRCQPATVRIREAVHDSVRRRLSGAAPGGTQEFHPRHPHDQPRGRRHRRADAAPAGPRHGGGDLPHGDDAAVSRRRALLALRRWCSPPASAAWWCSR